MLVPELTLYVMGQTVLGSVIIMAIIQKLKEWFGLGGPGLTILTIVLGGVLGVVGYFLKLVAPDISPVMAILQGLVSGWIATGLYDLIFKKK